MHVVRDDLRLDLECVRKVGERVLEEFQAGQVLEIAKMLALVCKLSTSQREDILEVASNGKQV